MTDYRYYKFCPRGFANEVTYYKVPPDKVAECEAEFGFCGSGDPGDQSYGEWTSDKIASKPGVAVNWADRNY